MFALINRHPGVGSVALTALTATTGMMCWGATIGLVPAPLFVMTVAVCMVTWIGAIALTCAHCIVRRIAARLDRMDARIGKSVKENRRVLERRHAEQLVDAVEPVRRLH